MAQTLAVVVCVAAIVALAHAQLMCYEKHTGILRTVRSDCCPKGYIEYPSPCFCPVDGGWSEWADVDPGTCSEECGPGITPQTRSCTNPVPQHDGKDCEGLSVQLGPCQVAPCPANIDGGWTEWADTEPGTCSHLCGPGVTPQTRTCTNPAPQFHGNDCDGLPVRLGPCEIVPCPVNGAWSEWANQAGAPCSKSCGNGMIAQTRTCTNPAPAWGGADCPSSDSSTGMGACNDGNCPVHGMWAAWADAPGTCSLTCGTGTKPQTRTCTNPAPAYGGLSCTGSSTQTAACKIVDCPVHGGWSSWAAGTCNAYCGPGTATNTRTCNNPSPAFGGDNCVGDSSQSTSCNVRSCTTLSCGGNAAYWYYSPTADWSCDQVCSNVGKSCNVAGLQAAVTDGNGRNVLDAVDDVLGNHCNSFINDSGGDDPSYQFSYNSNNCYAGSSNSRCGTSGAAGTYRFCCCV